MSPGEQSAGAGRPGRGVPATGASEPLEPVPAQGRNWCSPTPSRLATGATPAALAHPRGRRRRHRPGLRRDLGPGLGLEAERRLVEYGANVLPVEPGRSVWRMIVDQVADPMIALLVVAAVISGIVGEPADTIVITVIVLLNAVIGVVQERRAEQAMAALRAMSAPTAVVVRDGIEQQVDAAGLVPGDLVVLQDGAIVPADLRLLSLASLRIAEAALTGESQPVSKRVEPVTDPHAPVGDRRSMAFRGTFVAQGRGRGVVVGTGTQTELGAIADLLMTADVVRTPLQRRLSSFGGRIALAVVAHLRHRVRHRTAARRGPGADVPDRDQPRRGRRAGGPARGRRRDPRPGRAPHGPPQRARATPARGRDPRVGHLDLLGQDRDADREPDARRGAGACRGDRRGTRRWDRAPTGQRGRRRRPGRAPRRPRPVQRRDPGGRRHPGHRRSHRDRPAGGGARPRGRSRGAPRGTAADRRGALRLGTQADGDGPRRTGRRACAPWSRAPRRRSSRGAPSPASERAAVLAHCDALAARGLRVLAAAAARR